MYLGNYRMDHPMAETGILRQPRLGHISRFSTRTGNTQSKKSFCTNSILSSTPYILALCFAHAILIGSLSIAITRLELHQNPSTFVKIFCELNGVSADLHQFMVHANAYSTK